jgi:hypothetical protein
VTQGPESTARTAGSVMKHQSGSGLWVEKSPAMQDAGEPRGAEWQGPALQDHRGLLGKDGSAHFGSFPSGAQWWATVRALKKSCKWLLKACNFPECLVALAPHTKDRHRTLAGRCVSVQREVSLYHQPVFGYTYIF